MVNLRTLLLLTRATHTNIRVYDKERSEYILLNARIANDYLGETHVVELGTWSGDICAYLDVSAATIKQWKVKYGCN